MLLPVGAVTCMRMLQVTYTCVMVFCPLANAYSGGAWPYSLLGISHLSWRLQIVCCSQDLVPDDSEGFVPAWPSVQCCHRRLYMYNMCGACVLLPLMLCSTLNVAHSLLAEHTHLFCVACCQHGRRGRATLCSHAVM
jgi:hypothetical protein